jgi:hypothetical protein
MRAISSSSFCRLTGRTVPVAMLAGWFLLQATTPARAAFAFTNIHAVNVTPSSFSVFWQGAVDATPSIEVFTHPGGQTNLAGKLGAQAFPLHTGNPALAAGYERRIAAAALRDKTRGYGLMHVKVSGCAPNTTYYYRLGSTSGANTVNYPTNLPLPSVTTPRENTFLVNAQQLILDVPGIDIEGRIITITHTNASHPLAAVAGDGIGTNQVYFNLGELFELTGAGNLAPSGSQQFTVEVQRRDGGNETQAFDLLFGASFAVAQTTLESLGTEFVALSLADLIVRGGQATNLPIAFSSSIGVRDLLFDLRLPAGHLTNLALVSLAPEVDPASVSITTLSPDTRRFHLAARSGQFFLGAKTVAAIGFTALSNVPSAFVPMQFLSVTAAKPDSSLVGNVIAQSARVIVIGQEPLIEAGLVDGDRRMTVYGIPWMAYAVQLSTNLGFAGGWSEALHFPLTNYVQSLTGLPERSGPVFYRAVQFTPDPPVVDALGRSDRTDFVRVFGQPGATYDVQSATSLSSPILWNPRLTYTLTNAFRSLDVSNSADVIFYRLLKH